MPALPAVWFSVRVQLASPISRHPEVVQLPSCSFTLQIGELVLRKFYIDTFDESRGISVGPVGMLRFEFGADLFPGIIWRYAFTLERYRSRADFGDQVNFCTHKRTIARIAVVRQDMGGIEGGHLLQYRKPTGRRAAVAEDTWHGLVLDYVA